MTPWIIIGIGATGLVASLFYAVHQQRETAAELAATRANLEEQVAKTEAAVTVLASERKAMNEMSHRLEELERQRDTLEATVHDERRRREALEIENEEYQRWANSRLPDSAIRLLNTSPLYPNHGSGALQQRPSPDDTSVAPPPDGDDPQPAPDGPDRPVRDETDDGERPDRGD